MKNMITVTALAVALFAGGAVVPAVAQETQPVKVCTGAKTGNYTFVGNTLKSQLAGETDIEVVETAGSWENLQKLRSGECQAAVVQSDALYLFEKDAGGVDYFQIGDLYTEFVHLLCNRKSPVTQWSDLSKSTPIFSGGRGSGADVTARGLIQADAEFGNKSYVEVPLVNEQQPKVALMKVKGGAAQCLVYVGSRGNGFMTQDAQKLSADLVLVPVEDKDFNDVEMKDDNGVEFSVWTPTEMSYSTYEKLMPSGMFGRKDIPTIGVTAKLIVSQKLVNENPDAYASIGFAIGDVMNIVRAEKKVELLD